MRERLAELFPEGFRTGSPAGELTLGGDRLVFVLAGGLDLFLAERRADGAHGRPHSLADRLGPGSLVPPFPADDPGFVFYARMLPKTELAFLDAARVRALVSAGDALLAPAAFGFARAAGWTEEPRELAAFDAALAAWLDEQRLRPQADRAETRRRATAYAASKKTVLVRSLTLFKSLFRRTEDAGAAFDPNDPVGAAARRVAQLSGIPALQVVPGGDVPARMRALAERNRIRIPSVPLGPAWWREDFYPMLAVSADGASAWCVYRTAHGEPVAWDGASGVTYVADAQLADRVAPAAWSFVRPFPEGRVTLRDVADFFLRGASGMLFTIFALAFAFSCLSAFVPVVTGLVFSDVVPHADYGLLGQLTVLALAFSAASSVIYYFQLGSNERFRSRGGYRLQMALFDRMLRLPPAFFRGSRPAELNSRVQNCVTVIKRAVTALVKMGVNVVMMSVPLVMMFRYSEVLAGLVAGVLAVHLAAVSFCYWRFVRCRGEVTSACGRLSGLVERFMRGAAKLRAAGAGDKAFHRWAEDFADIGRTVSREKGWSARAEVCVSLLAGSIFCCNASVVIWGYFHGGEAAVLSVADYAAFVSTVGLVTGYVAWSLLCVEPVARAIPQIRWMMPILEAEPEPHEPLPLDPAAFTGAVELDRVSYAYPGGRQILKDVSIRADPGEFIAITGSSGAGKSTILRMLLRFEQPTSGAVLYDGKDVSKCDMTALRARIGVVMQEGSVMPDTVLRNIVGYGSSYTEAEAWEAARLAGCDDVIRSFPQQMQTVLTGGGVSGGQRQRFLLAHAMIRKPRLFFLDEATCSLDNATQRIVVDSLSRMKATRVVVAHRLSTIRDADRIYVLDAGRIAEVGTFDELLAKGGLFARLAKRQMANPRGE